MSAEHSPMSQIMQACVFARRLLTTYVCNSERLDTNPKKYFTAQRFLTVCVSRGGFMEGESVIEKCSYTTQIPLMSCRLHNKLDLSDKVM